MSGNSTSRRRRAIYIYTSTAYCLLVSTVLAITHPDLAKQLMDGLISLAELLAATYVGASVIDNHGLLTRFGGGGDDDEKRRSKKEDP